MDWIERIFGVSPDHGDHSTEISFAISLLLVIVVLFLTRYYMTRRSRIRAKAKANLLG